MFEKTDNFLNKFKGILGSGKPFSFVTPTVNINKIQELAFQSVNEKKMKEKLQDQIERKKNESKNLIQLE